MLSLHGGNRSDLEVSPNLWAGIGLVRPGAGTALVGSHEQVAERSVEYHELGLDEFILSGHPHLEEAYSVGENVLPLLRLVQPDSGGNRGPHVGSTAAPPSRHAATDHPKRRLARSPSEALTPRSRPLPPPYLAVALDGVGWHPAAWREADVDARDVFRPGTGSG